MADGVTFPHQRTSVAAAYARVATAGSFRSSGLASCRFVQPNASFTGEFDATRQISPRRMPRYVGFAFG